MTTRSSPIRRSLLLLAIAGCTGSEGPAGPAGAEGAQGAPGPMGTAGSAGAPGPNAFVGTTPPPNPTTGMFFYNINFSTLQVYTGTQWDTIVPPNSTVPPGMVEYYAASVCPNGWLEANGGTILNTTYAALCSVLGSTYGNPTSTTCTLPQLRGEFIRGWDHGRGVDTNPDTSARAFASFEYASSVVNVGYVGGSPAYAIASGYQDRLGWNNQFDLGVKFNANYGDSYSGITVPASGDGAHAQNIVATTTGSTVTNYNMFVGTRPRNVALLPCIKY